MNYTKTVLLILAGTAIVKIGADSAMGLNIYNAGGAVPTMMLVFVVMVPVALLSDWIARIRRRSRPADPRDRKTR